MPGLLPERDGYIPGVPCWVDTSQPDPDAAVGFYSSLFGWEFEDVMPPDSEAKYFIGRLRGPQRCRRRLDPRGGAAPGDVEHLHLGRQRRRDCVHDSRGRRERRDGTFDVMDAGRMAVFTDPEGAAFCVWEAKENKGAQIVNEPGSLNFNGINTRDVEGAKSFYGSVFGWRTIALPSGAGDLDAARLRRLSRSRQPRPPQTDGRGGRARGSRTPLPPSIRSRMTSPTRRRIGA